MGIGAPAVQEHQPGSGAGGPQLQYIGLASLIWASLNGASLIWAGLVEVGEVHGR
jgi:hypothetical protein